MSPKNSTPAGPVPAPHWEYCLVICTPLSGLDHEGVRLRCQVIGPSAVREVETQVREGSPLAGVAWLLNDLGRQGWELIAYDTSTNRGVLKRRVTLGEAP